jgi:membrane-bound inhibitor of C-type lysozyme
MKIRKPALLLAFIAGMFTLNACTKEKGTSITGTLSATVDGTTINFANVVAVRAVVDNQSFTNIQGTNNKDTLSITLPGNITSGKTYTSTAASDDDKALLLYSGKDDDYFNDDSDDTKIVTVNITSASGNVYQGTFKGNLTNTIVIGGGGSGTAKYKVVTNGKFDVKVN